MSMNISMSLFLLLIGTIYEAQYFLYLQVPGRKLGTTENKKMVLTNQVHLQHRYYQVYGTGEQHG